MAIMNKKRFPCVLAWLLLCCVPISMFAEQRKYLNIHLKSGSNVYFLLTENPKITIDKGILTVSTERFQLSNISKYTLDVNATDIVLPEGMEKMTYSLEGKVAYVATSKANEEVTLYSLDGKELPTHILSKDRSGLTIDLSKYQTGVYLLRIGSETLQIVLP